MEDISFWGLLFRGFSLCLYKVECSMACFTLFLLLEHFSSSLPISTCDLFHTPERFYGPLPWLKRLPRRFPSRKWIYFPRSNPSVFRCFSPALLWLRAKNRHHDPNLLSPPPVPGCHDRVAPRAPDASKLWVKDLSAVWDQKKHKESKETFINSLPKTNPSKKTTRKLQGVPLCNSW